MSNSKSSRLVSVIYLAVATPYFSPMCIASALKYRDYKQSFGPMTAYNLLTEVTTPTGAITWMAICMLTWIAALVVCVKSAFRSVSSKTVATPAPKVEEQPETVQSKLKGLVDTAKARSEDDYLPTSLSELSILFDAFMEADGVSDKVKPAVEAQIDALNNYVLEFWALCDDSSFNAEDCASGLKRLKDAIDGCTAQIRSHLRTVSLVRLADFNEGTARLAALREVNEQQ